MIPRLFVIAVVFCQLALLCQAEENHVVQVESALLHKVMKNYDKDVRPVKNASETINVKLGIYLAHVAKFDKENRVVTLLVWEQMEWHDYILSWDPANAEGIERLRVPQDMLWKPDIMMYDRLDVVPSYDKDVRTILFSSGKVYWTSRRLLTVPCDLVHPDNTWYCKMVFGSWVYDSNQVALAIRDKNEINMAYYKEPFKLKITGNKATHHQKHYPGYPAPFDDITYDFYFKTYD